MSTFRDYLNEAKEVSIQIEFDIDEVKSYAKNMKDDYNVKVNTKVIKTKFGNEFKVTGSLEDIVNYLYSEYTGGFVDTVIEVLGSKLAKEAKKAGYLENL